MITLVAFKLLYLTSPTLDIFTIEELMEGIHQNDSRLVEYIHRIHLFPPPAVARFEYKSHFKSQRNESLLDNPVASEVVKFSGHKKGFFIECRAFDGEKRSRTLELETQFEWQGLLMEPDPYLFPKLISRQRNAWLLNGCLSPDPIAHNQDFLRRIRNVSIADSNSTTNSDSASSSSIETRTLRRDNKGNFWKKLRVPCFPLYSVISALGVTEIDFLMLDSQGLELQILLNIPWTAVKIHVISVNVQSIPEGSEGVDNFLTSLNYTLVSRFEYIYTFVRSLSDNSRDNEIEDHER